MLPYRDLVDQATRTEPDRYPLTRFLLAGGSLAGGEALPDETPPEELDDFDTPLPHDEAPDASGLPPGHLGRLVRGETETDAEGYEDAPAAEEPEPDPADDNGPEETPAEPEPYVVAGRSYPRTPEGYDAMARDLAEAARYISSTSKGERDPREVFQQEPQEQEDALLTLSGYSGPEPETVPDIARIGAEHPEWIVPWLRVNHHRVPNGMGPAYVEHFWNEWFKTDPYNALQEHQRAAGGGQQQEEAAPEQAEFDAIQVQAGKAALSLLDEALAPDELKKWGDDIDAYIQYYPQVLAEARYSAVDLRDRILQIGDMLAKVKTGQPMTRRGATEAPAQPAAAPAQANGQGQAEVISRRPKPATTLRSDAESPHEQPRDDQGRFVSDFQKRLVKRVNQAALGGEEE